MNLINRAKNILISPKTEWEVIKNEVDTPMSLLMKYVLPMSLIPAIVNFLVFGVIGISVIVARIADMQTGIFMAIEYYIFNIVGYFITTYSLDLLAPSFGLTKDINRSAQLAAYSATAYWVASIFGLIPGLGILGIVGLYGLYLLYVGIMVLRSVPADKVIGYLVVSVLASIVAEVILLLILNRIFAMFYVNPFTLGNTYLR
jgi:hypothetical protein